MIGTKYFLKQARDEKYEEATFSFEEDAPPEAEDALKELLATAPGISRLCKAMRLTAGFGKSQEARVEAFDAALAKCRTTGLMEE